MNFSERLKMFRTASGLSQTEIAKMLGMTRQNYSRYENPELNIQPTLDLVCKLADIFGKDPNTLIGYIPKINEAEYARSILKNYEETDDCICYTYLLTLDIEKSPILNDVENHAYKDHKFIINLTKDEFLRFVKRSYNLARTVAQEESEQKRDEYFRSIINRMIFAHYLEYRNIK